jgi:hypothetical protein
MLGEAVRSLRLKSRTLTHCDETEGVCLRETERGERQLRGLNHPLGSTLDASSRLHLHRKKLRPEG